MFFTRILPAAAGKSLVFIAKKMLFSYEFFEIMLSIIKTNIDYINTRTGISSFSPFGVKNQLTLPIELLNFDASRITVDKVQLRWSTATENDNKGFEVERMLDTSPAGKPGFGHSVIQDIRPSTRDAMPESPVKQVTAGIPMLLLLAALATTPETAFAAARS